MNVIIYVITPTVKYLIYFMKQYWIFFLEGGGGANTLKMKQIKKTKKT